jgi:hypothetical protein
MNSNSTFFELTGYNSFFKYYKIPPIKYWNKDLHVDIQKVVDKPIDPMLIVETSAFT